VTAHSPVLASAASLDSLIHLSKHRNADKNFTYTAVALKECGLPDRSKKFITRWLDVTKSTLLFARGIILVEGIAEAMLLSVLAKKVLQDYNNKQKDDNRKLSVSLEDAGISVVNMNGIYFSHFFPLFCKYDELYGENIPVNCAGITDRDPPTTISKDGNKVPSKPTPSSPISDTTNHALELIAKVNKSANVRLYANALKTFEYDLAMEGDNLRIMCSIAKSLVDPGSEAARRFEQYEIDVWNSEKTENDRAEASFYLLTHIEKGAFAQALADSLENSNTTLSIPKYISDAVIWACEGTPNDI
jgi:predicted ATP-dependent endonuclease of OLD family